MARPARVQALAAVLAGGSSRRMGADKRLVEVDGAPLLTLAIGAAREVSDDVVVVTAPGRPVPPELVADVTVIEDHRPDAGPLGGVEAALYHEDGHAGEIVLVLAGDHPAASPQVLASLVHTLAATRSADVVALGTSRGPQPLVAAYRRSTRDRITRLLDEGERRATSLPDHLTVLAVSESTWRGDDPAGGTAFDVDTPEDLLEWEATR